MPVVFFGGDFSTIRKVQVDYRGATTVCLTQLTSFFFEKQHVDCGFCGLNPFVSDVSPRSLDRLIHGIAGKQPKSDRFLVLKA
jgi:hypothetical protein